METVFREEWGTALARSWDHWVDLPARAGDLVGELTGAAPGQVIVTDNTTVNLYKLAAAALDARPGRHVIITDHDNFPSDRYVMAGLAAQRGAELRMLATDINQGVHPDLVRAAVDEDTALVSLSHVAYRSGALADMAAITGIVQASGALMLWDLCHSVGAVPVDLDGCGVDLAVGCTYKYLNAGPGAPAFAYVPARLRERLRQPIWGWFSQRDQFAMGPGYDPAPGMTRFLTGTPSIPGAAAVEEGARLLLEAGIEPMRAKSMRLTAYLIELADAWLVPLGCTIATPREASRRGGHVSFGHPEAERIVARLAEVGVITDYRTPDRFRMGLSPLTTRFTDVWDAADAARGLIEGGGYG
jgi:kynureninase